MALVTKRVANACHRSAIFVVHFIVGGAAVLVAKLGTRRSTSVYRGVWAYRTRSEAFKDKASLQLHSKTFSLKQLCNSFKCKILKYKGGFACTATRTLVMNCCYSHDLYILLVLS